MILELDLGNTRGKWRIVDHQGALQISGTGSVDEWIDGDMPVAWSRIKRVRAGSVLSSAKNAALADRLQTLLQLRVEFAVATASCAGVRNAYADPGRLGVDRWLALIAAYRSQQAAVLVIDAGSALTVDAVNADGNHLGGYIVPGARLMERALLNGTDRVRFENGTADGFDLGADTGGCVHNGIAAAQCGTMLVALGVVEARLGYRPALIISGGWSELAQKYLAKLGVANVIMAPDLVLDGLRWVLPE
jgi:type III pantothenate kinase